MPGHAGGPERVRPSVQRLLDAMTAVPAYVRTGRLDILGVNRLGQALYAPVLAGQRLPVNLARFLFLDPRAGDFYVDWDKTANDAVAILRGQAGRNPYDRRLSDLVGELSTRSQEFRTRWGAHDVRLHRTGRKQLHHPVVGDLELTYEALELPADPGLTMITYTAEPGSASQAGAGLPRQLGGHPGPARPARDGPGTRGSVTGGVGSQPLGEVT